MILGIGIDMVEIPRISDGIKRHGERFIQKIAHPVELEEAPELEARQSEYWAARFAVKEAFAKALGTGIGEEVSFQSVGVTKNKAGKPTLKCSSAIEQVLLKRGVAHSHVAITHTANSAVAVVVLEGVSS